MIEENKTILKNDLIYICFALPILLIYILVMQINFGTVCPLLAFFKFPCPACGLTRASIYLLTGNFKESFNYNPTAILWIVTITLFLFNRYIKPLKIKPFPYIFIFTSIVTIIVYFYRIFTFS